MDQRDNTGQYGAYTPPNGPQQPQSGKKSKKGCGCLGILGLAIVVIIAIAVASGGDKTDSNNGTASSQDTSIAAAPTDTTVVDTEVPLLEAPTTTQPTVAEQVTYACTGSAPDGVDVTYGPSGSQYSASHLPFKKTVALDDSAQYYVTEAQLSGSGHVTCTTTIQRSDGSTVVNTATAEGGYNIASAQICSTFDGGWDKC